MCDLCFENDTKWKTCQAAWNPNRNLQTTENTIACLNCYRAQRTCSFRGAEFYIVGWLEIVDSPAGIARRKARNARSAKAKASAKRRKATAQRQAHRPNRKPTPPPTQQPNPLPTKPTTPPPMSVAPSSISTGTSVQEMRVRLPNLPEYEAVLSDPNQTVLAI